MKKTVMLFIVSFLIAGMFIRQEIKVNGLRQDVNDLKYDVDSSQMYDVAIDSIILRGIDTLNTKIDELISYNRKYLDNIGLRESNGNYHAVNTIGYLGKYQFSPFTLWYIGYKVTKNDFLRTPRIQDEAMLAYLKHNKKILRHIIETYGDTVHDGRLITESGILAAAHLAGAYGVRRYFKYKQDPSDIYGTKLSDYLYEFSGYNINI